MDKTWVKLHRNSTEYKVGLQNFIQNSLNVAGHEGTIKCPCEVCDNRSWRSPNVVYNHMRGTRMSPNYENGLWREHGEVLPNPTFLDEMEEENEDQSEFNLDMHGMLSDAFANNSPSGSPYTGDDGATLNIPPAYVERFQKLMNEADVDLYPGSTKMSKLEYLVRLYQIKCLGGISDKALSEILKLTKSILPDGETLPESFYHAKKLVRDLGLAYTKIDACPKDCIIYWKDTVNLDQCPTCGTSRYLYETTEDGLTTKVSAKVLRYFPVTPRLQRLFMSRCTSKHMTWHVTDRPNDGKMRHPADSPTWKELDKLYPSFAQEGRNVRLGLASDGFNPFGHMSSAHSTWPVVLTVYNLPPWLCMKQPYMLLSLIIPGPKAPGNDIDVFLAPLIEELKSLWDVGAATYDVHLKQSFTMRAALLWTINDFPAYANLSGWSTKGMKACPHCGDNTECFRLYHGKKFCYMGHRRFLPINHRFRSQKQPFNGKDEHRPRPKPMTGLECLIQLSALHFKFGKGNASKLPRRPKGAPKPYKGPWKKESVFFQLPYWKNLLIRHNLDVMHIEKNICDAVLGTLLGIDGKNKDSVKARADLVRMNIWPKLHPEGRGAKTFCPPAIFTLSNDEKTMMCKVFASFRPPDSFSSNIARCVQVKEKKFVGLKSHDCHIILHHLLPIAIRRVLPRRFCMVLLELSSFFRHLCMNNSSSDSFSQLTPRIVLVLCQLEKIFPPSFFDIMVHLPIHLAYEAAIAGPVHFRTMWPVERYLGTLKRYVRNKSRPEGSIAEGYIAEECLSFCSMYIEDSDSRRTRPCRNADAEHRDIPGGYSIFLNIGHAIGGSGKEIHMDYNEWLRVHRYVLLNCPDVEPFVDRHIQEGRRRKGRKRIWEADQESYRSFPDWFTEQVDTMKMDPTADLHADMAALAKGSVNWCTKHKSFVINGYRFRINRIDKKKRNQNCGVFVRATRNSYSSRQDRNPIDGELDYYGVLKDIIELNYEDGRKVVLFECDWCNSEGNSTGVQIDQYGFVSVNFKKLINDGDNLILASQAEQVFYVQDPIDTDWHVAIKTKPRDLYDLVEIVHDDPCNEQNIDDASMDLDEEDVRIDVDGFTVNQPLPPQPELSSDEDEDCEDDEYDDDDDLDIVYTDAF